MPELPEVETIKKGLEKTILGKKIADIEVRQPKIVSVGPKIVSNIRIHSPRTAQIFRRLLRGLKFVKIRRRAKMLILDLSPASTRRRGEAGGHLTLLIHLKM